MKKRVCSLLLAICMVAGLLALPAEAASVSRFSDVSDAATATNVEVLRLMGVMDGYGDGTFKPNAQLNRAQFCKMATYAMNEQEKLGLYRTVTVFPDVKPSHWAAPYINLMSRTRMSGEKGGPVIAGFPDGKFHPERPINLGQAATILLRILGYQDSDIGGVWPDSYMATASLAGLLKGLPTDGRAPLTRAQAARLFVNLLTAKKSGGGTLYTLDKEAELAGIDAGSGTMRLVGGGTYPMARAIPDSGLVGMHGQAVLDGETALTFLPGFGEGTSGSTAAVVLYADQSTAGLETLAGNTGYRIYKNGSPATAKDLRKYDVATYNPDTNSIVICDTRLSVYYEDCEPSPDAPAKIKVLGGSEFFVLPTAVDTLSRFRPGDQMILLLTADGHVAGAVSKDVREARENAMAIVSDEGKVELICGGGTLPLKVAVEEKYNGEVIRIASGVKNQVSVNVMKSSATGRLDVVEKTVGGRKLAENAIIVDDGRQIGIAQLNRSEIPGNQIAYVHVNWAGEADLIVLKRSAGETYGRVYWRVEKIDPLYDESNGDLIRPGYDENYLGVEFGNGENGRTKNFKMKLKFRAGEYVAIRINKAQTGISYIERLDQLHQVSQSAWVGRDLVNFGGRTYEVPEDVQCYNKSTGDWITLDKALAFSDTANLYVRNGFVRVIEVE